MRMNNEKIRIFFHSRIVYSCILLFFIQHDKAPACRTHSGNKYRVVHGSYLLSPIRHIRFELDNREVLRSSTYSVRLIGNNSVCITMFMRTI